MNIQIYIYYLYLCEFNCTIQLPLLGNYRLMKGKYTDSQTGKNVYFWPIPAQMPW